MNISLVTCGIFCNIFCCRSKMLGTIKENRMFLTHFIGKRKQNPNPFVSYHDVSERNGQK